jgi:hypothetical protein
MKVFKPLVAVGPEHALEDEILMADHFRKFYSRQCLPTFLTRVNVDGKDGLGGVHDSVSSHSLSSANALTLQVSTPISHPPIPGNPCFSHIH